MLRRMRLKARIVAKRRREGAAAVEFAMVALPFFILMLAIFEVALVLTVSALLEAATLSSARLVRTGQITETMDKQDFKREICARMAIFGGQCLRNIVVDVRPVEGFRSLPTPNAPPAIPSPVVDNGNGPELDEDRTVFDKGNPRDLMLVRVWYHQPTITPFLNQAMARMGDKGTFLQATSAFRNEPFA